MNLSALFIRRPVATLLLTVALVLLGLLAFSKLPVASLPEAEFPTLRISASLSGASPEIMATTVATPLENELSGIAGIKEMSSTSSTGSTRITLQFQLSKPIDEAIQEVQAALNSAQRRLPDDMTNAPTWRKVNPADAPILILNVYSPDLSLTALSDLTENVLARQMSQIDGIAEVNIYGQRKPALKIAADPLRLASYGLSFAELRQAISAASVNQPKGNLFGPTQTSSIDANDQLISANAYGDVVIRYQEGQALRVRDVATVNEDTESPYVYSEQNGRQGLNLSISRQPDANIVQTVDRLMAALPALQKRLPASVEIGVMNDRTRTIRATLHEVEITLLVTIALVIAVMGLFLRQWSATLIVGVVLIVSLIGTFAGMWLLGFSLNNLSLMALIIAVGFVVDDAIVVVENIHRHLEQGKSALAAALAGTREIGFTVMSISLSLIAAFIPLLLMDGIVGRLFREFALTVTLAIVMSLITALTLAPMLASRYMKHAPQTHGGISAYLERQYAKVLRPVLAHPWPMFGVFVLTVMLTVWAYISIPKGFIPDQDTGFVRGSTSAVESISFDDMVKKHQALAKIISQDAAVESYATSVGSTGGSQGLSQGRFFISLKPLAERKISVQDWVDRMRPKVAQVTGVRLSLRPAQELNLGVGTGQSSYQYVLRGQDIALLTEWASRLTRALSEVPVLEDVSNEQKIGALVTRLDIDRVQASRYGLSPADIDAALYDAFGQRQISQYQTAVNQYSILLGLSSEYAGLRSSLDVLQLRSPVTGGMVPLSSIARVLPPESGPVEIEHAGLYPAVTLSFNLAKDVALGDAVTAIERKVAQIGMPDEISGQFSGSAQAFSESLASQPLLIFAALLAVYIILGVLYESLLDPLVILSTLPSAGLGALLVLWMTGFELSIIALIGLILLIGIVKKNGILMVDFARQARLDGASAYDAIYQACLVRFRPITMTTVAALLGAIPLILGHGEGAELRQPLGVAVVGGLLISQVLTLLSTPVIYLLLESKFGHAKTCLAEAVPDQKI